MIDTINKALYSTLSGNTALTSQLSTSSAIYFTQAPHNAALPYIVYLLAGGREDNDSPIDAVDYTYYVKVIASSASEASEIAGLIRNALHEATLTLDAPWANYAGVQHRAPLAFVENVEHAQYWHAGGSYRIRASQ